MSTDAKPETKADIKPDAPPPEVAAGEKPVPPERTVTKKLDGYTVEYKGHPDTGWSARTVFDDGSTTDWGKCEGPPKDAAAPVAPGKAKDKAPPAP